MQKFKKCCVIIKKDLTYIRNQLEATIERESIHTILGIYRRHFRSRVAVTESKKKRDRRVFEQAQASQSGGVGKKVILPLRPE